MNLSIKFRFEYIPAAVELYCEKAEIGRRPT